MDAAIDLEWAQIAPDKILVATADRSWIHAPGGAGEPGLFLRAMQGPGSAATTRRLLDAAVGAGQRAIPPRVELPAMTPARWAWRLAGYYTTTHATPGLMAEAAARFAEAGRTALARWAARKAVDERGHDLLALRDLRALGYDAERVVEALVPPTAAALVAYFTAAVRAADPVRCVGYAYALERLALAQPAAYAARIAALLPAGVHATRCLQVHSAAGSDAGHIDDAVAVVAELSGAERAEIALACYETTVLCYGPPSGGTIADDALERALSPLKLSTSSR